MSILKLIAIVGVLIGAVSFVIEIRQKGKRSIGLFVALVIISAALFAVTSVAEFKIEERHALEASLQDDKAGESATANALNQAESVSDDPLEILDEEAVPDLPEIGEDEAHLLLAEEMDLTQDLDGAHPQDADSTESAQEGAVGEKALVLEDADAKAQEAQLAENQVVPAQAVPAQEAPTQVKPEVQIVEAAPTEAKAAIVEVKAAPQVAPVEAAPQVAVAQPAPPKQNSRFAPIAVAGSHMDDAKINEVIPFSCKRSRRRHKGASIASYKWDFGDGTTANTCEAKHAYSKIGTYIAKLTVTDKAGYSAVASRRIDVVRPEKRITFIEKKLPDLKETKKAPNIISGTYQKVYTGSKLHMEISGYVLSSPGCACELIVNWNGPHCTTTKRKKLDNGGEGELTVRATCSGALGEHTWSIERKISDKCACTFTDMKYEGSES